IIASGSTVILGLLCLLVSELNSNKSLGPVSTVGILCALAAALSFLPAALLVFGRTAFWPYRPKFHRLEHIGSHGLWHRAANFVGKRARLVWVVCVIVLIAAGLAMPTFKASGVPQTDALLNNPDGVVGERLLAKHFPAGSGDPVIIIADAANA